LSGPFLKTCPILEALPAVRLPPSKSLVHASSLAGARYDFNKEEIPSEGDKLKLLSESSALNLMRNKSTFKRRIALMRVVEKNNLSSVFAAARNLGDSEAEDCRFPERLCAFCYE
jgi:hypothetical protein